LTLAGFGRSWLLLSALCAAANATPPSPTPPAPAPAPANAAEAAAAALPPASSAKPPATLDEGFLEFLGSDDTGDMAWWEFLKKAAPRGSDSLAPPPQDAKK